MRSIEKEALLQLKRYELALSDFVELHETMDFLSQESFDKQRKSHETQVSIALEYCRWIEVNPNLLGDDE